MLGVNTESVLVEEQGWRQEVEASWEGGTLTKDSPLVPSGYRIPGQWTVSPKINALVPSTRSLDSQVPRSTNHHGRVWLQGGQSLQPNVWKCGSVEEGGVCPLARLMKKRFIPGLLDR